MKKTCPRCKGRGILATKRPNEYQRCERCKGTGEWPTARGGRVHLFDAEQRWALCGLPQKVNECRMTHDEAEVTCLPCFHAMIRFAKDRLAYQGADFGTRAPWHRPNLQNMPPPK